MRHVQIDKTASRTPDRSLRIAVLGSRGYGSTYGGFETLVRHLAPALAVRGHVVTVYGRASGRPHRVRVEDGVRTVTTLGVDSRSLSTLSFGLSGAVDAAIRGFDVALVVNIANGFFLPLLRARCIPAVVNVDGLEWERGKWGSAARRIFLAGAKASARWAATLVADSQAIASHWRRMFGVDPVFIPYGAERPPSAQPERVTELKLTPGRYVLVVARLAPENHVDLTLDAVDLVHPRPEVVVVGSSAYEQPLTRRLRALHAAGRVNWLGHVSDQALLDALWTSCGVYVHGHSVGGTNPALLQALACGAPTLARDTVFNREVLPHADQLFAGDASDLASALKPLLGDDVRRARLGERARTIATEGYAWPDVVTKYEDILVAAATPRA